MCVCVRVCVWQNVIAAASSDGLWRFFKGRKKSLWAWAEGRSTHAGWLGKREGIVGGKEGERRVQNVGITCFCTSDDHYFVASGNTAGFVQVCVRVSVGDRERVSACMEQGKEKGKRQRETRGTLSLSPCPSLDREGRRETSTHTTTQLGA